MDARNITQHEGRGLSMSTNPSVRAKVRKQESQSLFQCDTSCHNPPTLRAMSDKLVCNLYANALLTWPRRQRFNTIAGQRIGSEPHEP